ncbi:lon protease [Pyrenophora seminiperda CCB06]|uniref:Lon protease n=1 Tax=Pyrenophora seminiperda CCB06 TaxID=1302712 RepID=A0A3M7MIQ1_9PLEO|nr:lon protease [Pyrenophora seminiperda CCB06]
MSDCIKAVFGEGSLTVNTEGSLIVKTNDSTGAKQVQETSPTSTSSGDDTLNDDRSTDVRSNNDGAAPLSSPASPDALDFGSLTIVDESPRARKNKEERYSVPAQRGPKHNDTNLHGTPGRDFRGHNRIGFSYNGRGGAGGFRNSRTWMSPEAQAQQDFLMIRNSMRRLFKYSDVAKWKLSDYLAHREAVVASRAKKLGQEVELTGEAPYVSGPISLEVQEFLRRCGLHGNFDEVGNFGRVLGLQTIWCKDWLNGKDEVSPWPSIAEMKWEGDDRAKTGVGRFLPLPREEGPPGLLWNQLPVIEQYPIDQVCQIPTMEDVYLPVDYYIEEDHQYLWSNELEQEIDAFLGS